VVSKRVRRRHKVVWRKNHVKYRQKVMLGGALKLFLIFGCFGSLVWGGDKVYGFWKTSVFFPIADVEVSQSLAASVKTRGIKAGGPLFGFSIDKLEAELAKENPAVAQIDVRRTLSRRVLVTGIERRPLVRVANDGNGVGLDAEGVRFPLPAAAEAQENLILLSGRAESAHGGAAVRFFAKLKSLSGGWTAAITEIQIPAPGEWIYVLSNGTQVHWGNPDDDDKTAALKAQRLDEALTHQLVSGLPARVDFVSEDRIVVKFLSPAKGAAPAKPAATHPAGRKG
jgi:cell division septal protein FtsQ